MMRQPAAPPISKSTNDLSRTGAVAGLLLCLALPLPAFGVDGVLEISQTCALQSGCFPGDTPGYPVTISASGSYRLTSNLTGIGADLDGLFLANSRITIDFNGFSLVGATIGLGTGNGIAGAGTNGSGAGFATIKNGVIRGCRGLGVALGGAKGVRIEDMTFDFNFGGGAEVGDEARIVRSGFSDNGSVSNLGSGLVTGADSLVFQNVVIDSAGMGISTLTGSTISDNVASQNGTNGIHAGEASLISGNTARENGNFGIFGGSASALIGNTASQNGGSGIGALSGSTVRGNTSYTNGDRGMILNPSAAYRENVITNNASGAVQSGANLGDNFCQGPGTLSVSCP